MTQPTSSSEQQGYEPLDRRPIRARETRWADGTARWLARRGAVPNAISVAGMLAALAAGGVLVATGFVSGGIAERLLFLAAAALVQCRLLANLFDGMVALATGQASPVGELYNEAPDRISDAAILIGAGYAATGSPLLGLGAACVALFVAYVRALAKAAGAPSNFRGPMAKQQRMFLITITCVYLAVMPRGWRLAWGPGGDWGVMAIVLLIIIILGFVTALRRLSAAARHLRAAEGA